MTLLPDFTAWKQAVLDDVGDALGTALAGIHSSIAVHKDNALVTNDHRILDFVGEFDVLDVPELNLTRIINHGAPAATSVTTVASTVGQGKGLYLWTGSANSAPPANWYLASFDHSAWTTTIASTNTSAGAPAALSGSAWVTINNASSLPNTAQWLFFESFSLPAGTIIGATLSVQFDDYSRGAWLNGTQVIPANGTLTGASDSVTVDLSPSLLTAGGTNSLGLWDQNNTGFIAVDWVLTVTYSVAGVDPRYVVPTDLTAYQLRADKDAASGYAGLDSGTKVPTAELGSGSASSSTYLRGDRSWATLPSGFSDPMTSVGDTIIRNGSNVTDRLAKGADGTFLGVSSGVVGYYTPSTGGSLSTASAYLAADQTISTLDTYTDVVSVSLAAGTWLIFGMLHAQSTTGNSFTEARITDGTTTFAEAESVGGAIGWPVDLTPIGQVSPTGTTTYKLRAATHNNTITVKAGPNFNASGAHKTTGLLAVRVG